MNNNKFCFVCNFLLFLKSVQLELVVDYNLTNNVFFVFVFWAFHLAKNKVVCVASHAFWTCFPVGVCSRTDTPPDKVRAVISLYPSNIRYASFWQKQSSVCWFASQEPFLESSRRVRMSSVANGKKRMSMSLEIRCFTRITRIECC